MVYTNLIKLNLTPVAKCIGCKYYRRDKDIWCDHPYWYNCHNCELWWPVGSTLEDEHCGVVKEWYDQCCEEK